LWFTPSIHEEGKGYKKGAILQLSSRQAVYSHLPGEIPLVPGQKASPLCTAHFGSQRVTTPNHACDRSMPDRLLARLERDFKALRQTIVLVS